MIARAEGCGQFPVNRHVDFAFIDDVEAITDVPLARDLRSRRNRRALETCGQVLEGRRRQRRKKGQGLQKVDLALGNRRAGINRAQSRPRGNDEHGKQKPHGDERSADA